MSSNINQIPTAAASILATDKMYLGRSPFGVTDDRYILGSSIIGQFAPLTTKGDLYTYSTVATRLAVASGDGKFLQVSSGAATGLAWSTATLPSIATDTGTILRADGINWAATTATYPNTTVINRLLYSSSNNVIADLPTANSATVVTDAGGVPSLSQTLPSAVQANITALGAQAQALNMNSHLINNVTDPVSNQDAATMAYVLAVAQGRIFKDPCAAASTTALTVTYDNGASGVGATLTNAGAQAAFAIDGYTAALNDRILIKDQASSLQNGIYTVTTLGSGATNWVLSRATDMDQPAEFRGATTFIINGTTNAGRTYTETATVTTVGVDAVTFTLTGDAATSVSIVTQVISATGTYTPTTGMVSCVVYLTGGGAGGGGVAVTGAGNAASASGGGAGGTCIQSYTAASLGANAAVVIGAAGAGGVAGNPGAAGGNSTFTPAGAGAVLTTNGGAAGQTMAITGAINLSNPGKGGTASGGQINAGGGTGAPGIQLATAASGASLGGCGGNSYYGGGGKGRSANQNGEDGLANGAGGGGAAGSGDASAYDGGAGVIGICYVVELVVT